MWHGSMVKIKKITDQCTICLDITLFTVIKKNDKCFCGTETAAEVYTLQNSHQPKQCLNLLFLVWHKTFNS